jgi:hypothetical protein
MLSSISPRPTQMHISRGNGLLLTNTEGLVSGEGDQGLYVRETRMLSKLQYLIEGKPPKCVVVSPIEQQSSLGYYICPAPKPGGETAKRASKDALELRVRRHFRRGLTEELALANYTNHDTRFVLEVELEADFADFRKARKGTRKQHGELTRHWRDDTLIFDYRASHSFEHQDERGSAYIHRQSQVRLLHSDSAAQHQDGRLRFEITLAPHARWRAELEVLAFVEESNREPDSPLQLALVAPEGAEVLDANFREQTPAFSTPESQTLTPVVVKSLERAREDIIAMRRYDLDTPGDSWTVAAGVPGFTSLFGRDLLNVGWQAAMLGPQIMQGGLEVVSRLQGERFDRWRDEQPGQPARAAPAQPLVAHREHPRTHQGLLREHAAGEVAQSRRGGCGRRG